MLGHSAPCPNIIPHQALRLRTPCVLPILFMETTRGGREHLQHMERNTGNLFGFLLFKFDNGSSIVLSATTAQAMRLFRLATFRAGIDSRPGKGVMSATGTGSGMGMSVFW